MGGQDRTDDDPGDKEQSSPEEKGKGRAKRKEWVFFLFGRWGLKPELRPSRSFFLPLSRIHMIIQEIVRKIEEVRTWDGVGTVLGTAGGTG